MSMRRTPMSKASKKNSQFYGSNPFDSDSEPEENSGHARASAAPPISNGNSKIPKVNHTEDERRGNLSYTYEASKGRYKKDFCDSGGLENQPLQELENYAVYKAEETTQKLNDCLRIAEEMREDAARTLVNLHQQSEQINRTHLNAANMEHDLSRGEKLLGSLGGLFSKTWKPKKTGQIKGPVHIRDDSVIKKGSHLEQKQRLGLSSPSRVHGSNPRQYPSEPASALEKVEVEKAKQDDTLSYVSDLLGQLKEMALDMGSEIESQNKGLDHLQDDVETLNDRVKGANRRARHLLGR